MRRISLLAAGLFSISAVHAQIDRGTTLLGSDVMFEKATDKRDGDPHANTRTVYYITPSIGRAISDDLVAGVRLLYGYSVQKNYSTTASISKNSSYGAGLFIRRYKKVAGGLNVFLEARLQGLYQYYTQADRSTGVVYQNNKTYNVIAGLNPGLAYAATRRIWLEIALQNLIYAQYQHTRGEGDGMPGSTGNDFAISTAFNSIPISLGFKILLD